MKKHLAQFTVTVFAVLAALGGYQYYQSLERDKYMQIAFIFNGFNHASLTKVQIEEYLAFNDKLPISNVELGLPEPADYADQSLRSITVGNGGVISLVYDKRSGVDNGVVQFVPDISNQNIGLRWTCQSPSFKTIQEWAPGCVYVER